MFVKSRLLGKLSVSQKKENKLKFVGASRKFIIVFRIKREIKLNLRENAFLLEVQTFFYGNFPATGNSLYFN